MLRPAKSLTRGASALALCLLLVGGCTSQVNVGHANVPIADQNDIESPAPTPVPTATPVPPSVIVSPTPAPSPGWLSVTLTASADTYADLLAEVRSLEAEGDVSNVSLLANGQISLSGPALTIAALQETASARPVAFRTLVRSNLFIAGNVSLTITNGDDFTSFWRENITRLDNVPGVDFNSQSVIAVIPGPQGNSGYSTSIVSVRLSGKRLKVRYRIDAPASASVASNANPVHVAVISASRLRGDYEIVDFERVF